jgi:DNA-binding IclR family transcriptional regulator
MQESEAESTAPNSVSKSLNRCLRIIALLAAHGELGLTRIGEMLEIPVSSVHRLVHGMCNEGYLLRCDGGGWRVGYALVDIGSAAGLSSGIVLQRAARQPLHDLSAELGETVSLAVLDLGRLRILESVQGTRAVRVAPRCEGEMSPAASAEGKILLATGRRALSTALELGTVTQDQTSGLEECAARGWALDIGSPDVHGIAVPVRDARGQALAALSIYAPSSRMPCEDLRQAVPILQVTSRNIGRALEEASRYPPSLVRQAS